MGPPPPRFLDALTLFGVERGGRMHLKYKTAQFVVSGSVMAVCRRCSEINETVVGHNASVSDTVGLTGSAA